MGAIRPEVGALFGPKKNIRAGENLFAWNSARFLALSGSLQRDEADPFYGQRTARRSTTARLRNRRASIETRPSVIGTRFREVVRR